MKNNITLQTHIKYLIAVYVAKLAYLFINLFHLGAGYTWPGHLALKLCPNLLSFIHLKINFSKGLVVVTGTNGKTTTTKLLTHLLSKQGLKVVHNKSGANLLNGIVSQLIIDSDFMGVTKADIGVFEVDEFNLPIFLKCINPTVLVLLNLSRDQLDRYGETDIIFEKWKETLASLKTLNVIYYDGQPEFNELTHLPNLNLTTFGASSDYLSFSNLLGSFNAKNINAVVKTLSALTIPFVHEDLKSFDAAYGRGEHLTYQDKDLYVFLAKNPASFNNNLLMTQQHSFVYDSVLVVLNDNIPDGRDVSWIYDIDPLLLKQALDNKQVYVCGKRYLDMCIRLEYAGISDVRTCSTLDNCLNLLPPKARVLVLPNYSAMLDVRHVVTGKKIL